MAAPTPLPQRLADAFIVLLQTRLNSEQVKLIQHGDADPDDFCDANMVMADAFEDVMGRETYMPSDVEEARCTEAQADADLALWNEAVAIAQARSYGLDGIDMSASMPTAAPATADMGDALTPRRRPQTCCCPTCCRPTGAPAPCSRWCCCP